LTSTFASHTPPQSPSQHLSSSHKSFPFKTPKNSSHIRKGEWGYLLKKREKGKEKEREAHSPFQVAIYGVQITGKLSTSFLHTLRISHVP